MAPPHTPGIPGQKLPPPPPVREELDPGANRRRHDSRAELESEPPSAAEPRVEIDPSFRSQRSETEAFQRDVHANYGKASFRGPAWVFVIIAGLGLSIGTTYYVTRHSDGSRPPQDEVLAAVNALKAEVAKRNNEQDLRDGLILQRVGQLETQNGVTQAQLTAILMQLRGTPR